VEKLSDDDREALSSMMMPPDEAMTNGSVRRIEVFTGAGHRRRWTKEEKARIVAESYGGWETASAVTRRYEGHRTIVSLGGALVPPFWNQLS
jgi:hypothetical protein